MAELTKEGFIQEMAQGMEDAIPDDWWEVALELEKRGVSIERIAMALKSLTFHTTRIYFGGLIFGARIPEARTALLILVTAVSSTTDFLQEAGDEYLRSDETDED